MFKRQFYIYNLIYDVFHYIMVYNNLILFIIHIYSLFKFITQVIGNQLYTSRKKVLFCGIFIAGQKIITQGH